MSMARTGGAEATFSGVGVCFSTICQFGYCAQQQTPMTERRYANLFEVLISQDQAR